QRVDVEDVARARLRIRRTTGYLAVRVRERCRDRLVEDAQDLRLAAGRLRPGEAHGGCGDRSGRCYEGRSLVPVNLGVLSVGLYRGSSEPSARAVVVARRGSLRVSPKGYVRRLLPRRG